MITILPASQFTFEELAAAYNQTRVDYVVPMPMNAARLSEYVRNYDVNLDVSPVAVRGSQILGLAMLGVRPRHTWVTRLGVLPAKRKCGTGRLLMEHVIDQSLTLLADRIILEVIDGNAPAHCLFRKMGFRDIRKLLVLRRPPGPPAIDVSGCTVDVLDRHHALDLLRRRRSTPSWLDDMCSLENARSLNALGVELETGNGWVVYQISSELNHLVLQTEAGDPHLVGLALLHALHACHPELDTYTENLPVDDPHWPSMRELGYHEAFRRIEMRLDMQPALISIPSRIPAKAKAGAN